jgi:hypothetical protein
MKAKVADPTLLSKCIDICRPCHSAIHRIIDEKTMASSFETVDKLLAHMEVQRFISYVCKQKARPSIEGKNNKLKYKK